MELKQQIHSSLQNEIHFNLKRDHAKIITSEVGVATDNSSLFENTQNSKQGKRFKSNSFNSLHLVTFASLGAEPADANVGSRYQEP